MDIKELLSAMSEGVESFDENDRQLVGIIRTLIAEENTATASYLDKAKKIQELGYDTTQSAQMIQLLFDSINSGLSIQDAIYNTFGKGLSDTDYNNILKAYSDAIGTGVLNMGQNIQSLKNTINSFYETAMK